VLLGDNFGSTDQHIIFGGVRGATDLWRNKARSSPRLPGVELDDSVIVSSSHTELRFTVPAGVGKEIPVQVRVGKKLSNEVLFSYDPPFVTRT
jgi:hypothetical protein